MGELVGRAAELEVLRSEFAAAHHGRRLVLIEGEAGMGKTSLVRAFLDEIGVDPVSASGDQGESLLPYGVVEQLIAGVGSLSSLFTDLRQTRDLDPLAVGAQLLDVLVGFSGEHPMVVVIDDAQWADVQSLQALAFAFRRLRAEAVLAITVARDRAEIPPVAARLIADHQAARIRLSGLDDREVAHLAAQVGHPTVSRRTAEQLRAHTGGSPLHVRTLLEQLEPGSLTDSGAVLPAPRSFAMLVLNRLARCKDKTRALVVAASTFPSSVPLHLLAELADVDDPLAALDEAEQADLLLTRPTTPVAVEFVHPLVRAAIYHDLGPVERTSLHEAAAGLLDERASLDHRAAAATSTDEALSVALERDGDRRERTGGPDAAVDRYLTAARLTAERQRQDRLVLRAANVIIDAGNGPAATELAERIAGCQPGPERSYVQGRLALMGGRADAARSHLEEAWDQVTGDADLAVRIASELAGLEGLLGEPGDAVRWARRALEGGGRREHSAASLSVLAANLAILGRVDEAMAAVAGLDEQSGAVVDVEALLGRGLARLWGDDPGGAADDLERVVELSRERPASRPALLALGYLADAEFRLGRWDDSIIHGDLLVSLVADSEQGWLSGFARAHASWVASARGDWSAASIHVNAARSDGSVWSSGVVASAAAHLASCRGDPAAVVAAVHEILDGCSGVRHDAPGVHPWRELQIEALLGLGQVDEACRALDQLEAEVRERDRRSCLPALHRLRAGCRLATGDEDGAIEAFEHGVADPQECAGPFALALLDDAYGRFLRRRGRRAEAVDRLVVARRQYEQLGAVPFLERVDRELAAAGQATPSRRHGVDPTELTPQELAVARLVANGCTNKEVAAELIVSVKTVEYHLGHVFAKWGLTSRRELARRFRDRRSDD